MKIIWNIVSIISHPLLIVTYGMILLMLANPYLFGSASLSGKLPFLAIVFFSTFIIPALAVAMMKVLNMVQSFQLETRRERVGPLFATCVLYAAFYFNVARSDTMPEEFASFLFGAMVSLFMCLFINSFYKISLHAVGIFGLVMGLFIFYFTGAANSMSIAVGDQTISISFVLIPLFALLLAGVVSAARMHLKAHSLDEILAGWLVGVAGQVLAVLW